MPRSASFAMLLGLALTGSIAEGAPARPIVARAAAPDALSAPAVCGTRLGLAGEAVEAHLGRALQSVLPTPHSTDVGEIAVLEDDGNFFYTNKGGDAIADLAAIAPAFYRTHGDDYDALAIFLSDGLSTYLGSYTAIAAAFVIRNDIEGIGEGPPFDYGSQFGSPSRLQNILSMNGLQMFPPDPTLDIHNDGFSTMDALLHEFGHRWLAYIQVDSAGTPSTALLGRSYQHWSFFLDADSSLMEGCDWISPAPDSFRTDGIASVFSDLDLYLMGLRSKAETPPFFTVHDGTDYDPPGVYVPYTGPFVGLGCRGRAHWWSVDDIEAAEGVRVPDAASAPHTFRVGFVLVTARGQDATPADLAEVENIRNLFPTTFAAATRGLGTIDPSLDSRAGSVAIAHDPVKDQLNPASPVPLGARVTIEPAGIPIGLDAASIRVDWRLGTSGPFSSLPLAPVSPDSFAADLPAPGSTGVVQYYLYASSDSAGIEAFEPPAGAAAPHTFTVGPDLTPPVIVHVPIPSQGEARMPVTLLARVTDNVGLDSVLVYWGVNGSLTFANATTLVGRDSFATTLGYGLTDGQTLTYAFAARDGSGNFTLDLDPPLSGAPHTLAVGLDWAMDFENGSENLFHGSVWYSYRDAWHPSEDSSSPGGGTSWKCGDLAPDPYPDHLDAALYLPQINDVEPGTILRFDHRFELEDANGLYGWDGGKLESQVGAGPWNLLTPEAGYSHLFLHNSNPFQRNTPCWSGSSGGWRSEDVDLSAFAPGPVRVRFRLLADDFFGFDGWSVDHIRVIYPGNSEVALAPATLGAGSPWPNPSRGWLRQSVSLDRTTDLDWSLFDLAGRRVAVLRHETVAPGRLELSAGVPEHLGSGVYFLRLSLGGRLTHSQRVAVVR